MNLQNVVKYAKVLKNSLKYVAMNKQMPITRLILHEYVLKKVSAWTSHYDFTNKKRDACSIC